MADTWTLMLGNNRISNCDAALTLEGEEVFRLRERLNDGQLVVDFDLRDPEGNRIARIQKNQPVFAAEGFTVEKRPGRYAVLRNGEPYATVSELSPGTVKVTGTFNVKGFQVLVTDDAIRADTNTISGNVIDSKGLAIALSRNQLGIGLARKPEGQRRG